MANYNTLQEAVNAGETNMEVLRDYVKNDDSTTTYSTGIDWFKFNGNSVTNIYSNGNSWLGFGSSNEHLRVNRRDGAVWYEYKEIGTINGVRYFKFRWKGTSYYNQPYYSTYQSVFDVFLFENEIIYLNWEVLPTSYFNGTNSLTSNEGTYPFYPSAGVPCEYYWIALDDDGNGWNEPIEGKPDIRPPRPPMPVPDIPYDFVDGLYRVILRSSYTVLGSNQVRHRDSAPYEFTSIKPAPPGEMYSFAYNPQYQVDTDNLYAYYNGEVITEISEQGTSNGLNYKIYDGIICIITGTQESTEAPSGGYPWNPSYPETYPGLLFYVDANLISLNELFIQNSSGAHQNQITFGKNCTFSNPIDCSSAFSTTGGENVYISQLQCIDNISGQVIHISNAQGMFSGIALEFHRPDYQENEIDEINWNFWTNSLDFSACTNISNMFKECHSGNRDIDFSMHNLSNVTSISSIFRNCNVDYIDFGQTLSQANTYSLELFFYGDYNNVDIDEFTFNHKISGARYAFRYCSNLETVNLAAPEPVTSSGSWAYAFNYCSSLRFLNLQNQKISVSSSSERSTVFAGCNNLEVLVCPAASNYTNPYWNISLPKTMYDVDGNSYTVLPDNNRVLFADPSAIPDWFDFVRTPSYNLIDDQGNSISINNSIAVEEHVDGNKKYKVYGNNELIVANNDSIVYPSEYNNTPKWVITEN